MASRDKTDRDCFYDLGLGPAATYEEVKKSFRKIAMKCHPDRSPSPADEERFKTVSVAYAQLTQRYERGRWGEPLDQNSTARAPSSSPCEERSAQPDKYRYAYPSRATYAEIATDFFGSWLGAARAFVKDNEQERGAPELARAFLKLFKTYEINGVQAGLFKAIFLQMLWTQEQPGLMQMAESAKRLAEGRYSYGADDVADMISPGVTLYKPFLFQDKFSVLDAIATPRKSADAARSRKFHEEMARVYKSLVPVEAYETENEDYLRSQNERLFAQRLMSDRPELFAVYHKAGWMDFSHPLYAKRKVDIISELWDSPVSWADKGAILWERLGGAQCAMRINEIKDATLRLSAAKSFEDRILSGGWESLLDQGARTDKINERLRAAQAYRQLKKLSLPGPLAKAFISLKGRRPDSAQAAFEAVAKRDIEALELALSDYKFSGASADGLVKDGTRLADFIAWAGRFETGAEAFCASALDGLKSRFGAAALGPASAEGAKEWLRERQAQEELGAKRPAKSGPSF